MSESKKPKAFWVKYDKDKGWHIRGVPGYFTDKELREYAEQQKTGNPGNPQTPLHCEREATDLFNKLRTYVKTRDSFQGADLLCRIGHPEDYPNKCPVRNDLQETSFELENELLEAIRTYNKCLIE